MNILHIFERLCPGMRECVRTGNMRIECSRWFTSRQELHEIDHKVELVHIRMDDGYEGENGSRMVKVYSRAPTNVSISQDSVSNVVAVVPAFFILYRSVLPQNS